MIRVSIHRCRLKRGEPPVCVECDGEVTAGDSALLTGPSQVVVKDRKAWIETKDRVVLMVDGFPRVIGEAT